MATVAVAPLCAESLATNTDLSSWTTRELGVYGEHIAGMYLENRGLELIDQNWRCNGGEVDIVAKDEKVHVLVEVKTRTASAENLDEILPELAVDGRKRRRYRRLALYYIADHPWVEEVRFDVVAVSLCSAEQGRIHHVINAFEWKE